MCRFLFLIFYFFFCPYEFLRVFCIGRNGAVCHRNGFTWNRIVLGLMLPLTDCSHQQNELRSACRHPVPTGACKLPSSVEWPPKLLTSVGPLQRTKACLEEWQPALHQSWLGNPLFPGITFFQQACAAAEGAWDKSAGARGMQYHRASPNPPHVRNVSQNRVSSDEVFPGKCQIILTFSFSFTNIKGVSFC